MLINMWPTFSGTGANLQHQHLAWSGSISSVSLTRRPTRHTTLNESPARTEDPSHLLIRPESRLRGSRGLSRLAGASCRALQIEAEIDVEIGRDPTRHHRRPSRPGHKLSSRGSCKPARLGTFWRVWPRDSRSASGRAANSRVARRGCRTRGRDEGAAHAKRARGAASAPDRCSMMTGKI